MSIQGKAFQIIYDIIGIVLKWDEKQLSDKEAMNEIVDALASDPKIEEELEQRIKKKKSNFLQKQIGPLAIGAVFIVILFVAVNPFTGVTNIETTMPAEEKKIGFEQMDEMQSDVKEKIQNNTVVEEFDDITNLNEG